MGVCFSTMLTHNKSKTLSPGHVPKYTSSKSEFEKITQNIFLILFKNMCYS